MHDANAESAATARSPLPGQSKPPPRIIVADDDDMMRMVNTEALVRCGYAVDAAPNGALAWEALQAARYDLLITDNSMPEMSGIELLKKLHQAHITLPVIMATGTLPEKEFDAEPWLRPTAILVKPYALPDLIRAVQKILPDTRPR